MGLRRCAHLCLFWLTIVLFALYVLGGPALLTYVALDALRDVVGKGFWVTLAVFGLGGFFFVLVFPCFVIGVQRTCRACFIPLVALSWFSAGWILGEMRIAVIVLAYSTCLFVLAVLCGVGAYATSSPPPLAEDELPAREPDPAEQAMARVWDGFFEECVIVGRELMVKGQLSAEEVEEISGECVVGLPGCVLFRAALRTGNQPGIMLADGSLVQTAELDAGNPVVVLLMPPFTKLAAMLTRAELTEDEQTYVTLRLLGHDLSPSAVQRRPVLGDVYKDVMRLALAVTQVDVFKYRTTAVFNELSSFAKPAKDVGQYGTV